VIHSYPFNVRSETVSKRFLFKGIENDLLLITIRLEINRIHRLDV
jgi:hypothetical protein